MYDDQRHERQERRHRVEVEAKIGRHVGMYDPEHEEEWRGKTQQWQRREKGRRTKHLEKDARHLCSGANV
jgi:predicted P-loop ATPase